MSGWFLPHPANPRGCPKRQPFCADVCLHMPASLRLSIAVGFTQSVSLPFLIGSGGGVEFFFQQLSLVEGGIFAVEGEQFFVGPAFDNVAVMEDADQVGISNC
jgi:hypothetical protein